MNFRHRSGQKSEPEINLVPLIDVMLVIIIFLMMTTTFSKTAGLEISLPTVSTDAKQTSISKEIRVAVTATGDVTVNGMPVQDKSINGITKELIGMRSKQGSEPVININADAQASHQSVINVMQAAQNAKFLHVTFEVAQERKR